MLRELTIDNFRALRHFEMRGLGRINLIVGTNNCGKTSVLEALNLLLATTPDVLWSVLSQRGELIASALQGEVAQLDISHLFEGHALAPGQSFVVEGEGEGEAVRL